MKIPCQNKLIHGRTIEHRLFMHLIVVYPIHIPCGNWLDGGALPNGVYLYRLEAGGQIRTNTMTLVK